MPVSRRAPVARAREGEIAAADTWYVCKCVIISAHFIGHIISLLQLHSGSESAERRLAQDRAEVSRFTKCRGKRDTIIQTLARP